MGLSEVYTPYTIIYLGDFFLMDFRNTAVPSQVLVINLYQFMIFPLPEETVERVTRRR